jgi:serine/threonine protein phosphatase PrpC
VTTVGTDLRQRSAWQRHTLLAAGRTDAGVQREVNEDRFHVDAARGLFAVIDGVGGQAAGGKAADVALAMLRERLERETGPVSDRIREAIAIANNEIHRLASTRAEWEGMACVLSVAVVADGKVTFGHVGDTRLYRIQGNRIEKITRDHSPVGEREDAGELSELQAMRHPRRNEVYRDVGSDIHDPADAGFVDSDEIAFEPDTALLLCTDGLTDLVDSSSIVRLVHQLAGNPEAVVRALVDAANAAGGKDNVTVVYVEGEQFAASQWSLPPVGGRERDGRQQATRIRHPGVRLALVALLVALIGVALVRTRIPWPSFLSRPPAVAPALAAEDVLVVQPDGSIAAALRDAAADSEIIVEPGEYREQLALKDRVRLISRVPRGATIRLPAAAPDAGALPAVVASGLSRAELSGFRIVGDSATPLAVGIHVEDSALSIVDVEITGATSAGIEFSGGGTPTLLGSDIHDNPGPAIVVRAGSTPRIAHNAFARNGISERARGALDVATGARPQFFKNTFLGLSPDSFLALDDAARRALSNENWFVPVSQRRPTRAPVPSRPQRTR